MFCSGCGASYWTPHRYLHWFASLMPLSIFLRIADSLQRLLLCTNDLNVNTDKDKYNDTNCFMTMIYQSNRATIKVFRGNVHIGPYGCHTPTNPQIVNKAKPTLAKSSIQTPISHTIRFLNCCFCKALSFLNNN